MLRFEFYNLAIGVGGFEGNRSRQHRTKAVLQKALGVIDVWLFFMIRASVVAWDATQDMRVAVLVEG